MEVARAVLLDGHAPLGSPTAASGYLLVCPGAGIDVDIAVDVKLRLRVHSDFASKNLLCVDESFLHVVD
jgi:hypothetical protein